MAEYGQAIENNCKYREVGQSVEDCRGELSMRDATKKSSA